MKKFLPAILALLFCSTPAFAWNCSDSLAARVPVPSGTSGSFGNGDGQLFLGTGTEGVKGQLYQCQVPKPPVTPPTPPTTSKQNQTQQQSQTQSANSTSSSSSKATSNASAQGGTSNSNSQGGNATGGSVSGSGNSQSTLKNSGNSSNTNSNSAQGGTGGTASSSNNSSGNVTSFSSVDNQVRQTPPAYAPDAAFTTSPCVKGFSGGVSSPGLAGSLGISKTDKGCDSRQAAVIFFALGNKTAAARILCSTDAAKRAKLTVDECLAIVAPTQQVIVREAPVTLPAPPPQVIVIQAPQPVLQPQVVPQAVVAPPQPDCKLRTVASSVHYTRVCKASVRVATIGTCGLHNGTPESGCYIVLDEAIGAAKNNERILLTGPIESGRVISYLKQHKISLDRITLKLADEQNSTLLVQIEIGE